MIKLLHRWLITRFKVNIRSITFWLMTVFMVAAFMLTGRVYAGYSDDTRVLIYTGDTELGEWCMEGLWSRAADDYIYEEYEVADGLDGLISRIEVSDAACGVAFMEAVGAKDLTGTMDPIGYGESGYDGISVMIYQSPGSADGYVLREILYPLIAEYYAEDGLAEYVRGELHASADNEEIVSYITDRYRYYADNLDIQLYEVVDMGATDSFGSSNPNINTDAHASASPQSNTPILIYIFIISIVLIAAIYDAARSDSAFYKMLRKRDRLIIGACGVVETTVMSTVAAALTAFLVQSIF